MKHLSEGELQALHDGALAADARECALAHLAECAACAARAADFAARSERVQAHLAALRPTSERVPLSVAAARRRLDIQLKQEKEKEISMIHNLFSKRYRLAWALAALALFLGSFSFAPVRALASDFLALFRVEQITFVQMNSTRMPDEAQMESVAPQLEALLGETMETTSLGEPRTVDAATARAEAGFAVRLPGEWVSPTLTLAPGSHAQARIDLPRIRALLAEMGYGDIALPDSLDGQQVGVDFHTALSAQTGDCTKMESGDCMVLVQMPVPTFDTPPEMDVAQLGLAYLQLLGMTPEEAADFSRTVDWSTTLVVPLPPADAIAHREVTVDGVQGNLIYAEQYTTEYSLIWVKSGILYLISGNGSVETALFVANSLQ